MTTTVLRGVVLACLLTLAPGCNSDPTGPSLAEADLRILFIGNSLTYSNDLPGLVRTIAAHKGISISTAMVARPNYALEDHWNSGIESVIRDLAPDVVIMQQGPSSLPESRLHLVEWTERLAGPIREVGARPALLQVWPDLFRVHAFDDVRDSYKAAADAVDGDFIPFGEVMRGLLAVPGITPVAHDSFHPSGLGTIAGAAMVLRAYFPDVLEGLPDQIQPPPGDDAPQVHLTPEQAAVVWSVVERVAVEWGF